MTETSRRRQILPVLPLKNAVVFPHVSLPISVGRPASLAAVEAALESRDRTLLVLAQRDAEVDEPQAADLFTIGTTARIKLVARAEATVQIILEGLVRAVVEELIPTPGHLRAWVRPSALLAEGSIEAEALQRELMDLTGRYFALGHPEVQLNIPTFVAQGEDIMQLVYPLAQLLALEPARAQGLLEAPDEIAAMRLMRDALIHEIQVLQLRRKIASNAQEKIDREQRDYVLRQQLHAIHRELGDKNPMEAEVETLRQRLGRLNLPEEAMQEAKRELNRLEQLSPAAPDYQVIRSHLDLVLELPWQEATTDNLDLARARQILDQDHYGLAEVKERIIEQLAVMKLNPDARGPILCFVGPPGVGKTSLGQSIARALDRKFQHFSLGGMHDEAELRGHRRTYVGAMPGRIIQAIRRAGVKNPLLMLDEVDKLGRDFRGDPAAALMEILDPAQNQNFRDNYLDLPFDLSRVFFITTANAVDTVPKPLLDRMETLRLSGYSDEEKLAIARLYLLPRQRTEAGLGEEQFLVPDQTLATIIRRYTREAGVRELERMLGRLARKAAVGFAEGKTAPVTVAGEDLAGMLGPERFFAEELRRELPCGVATGLAWTDAGGDVLYIEAIGLPGDEEKLTLTGQLGEVMKESAITANSYLLAHGAALGITAPPPVVHIHVPAGAIPKDGPSAGVSIAAALASLYTDQSTRHDTAMTGEITLSGLVLPVGGIKEKILAARRAGILRVVLPGENRKDLRDLPDQVLTEMEFIFANRIEEALAAVLATTPPAPQKRTAPPTDTVDGAAKNCTDGRTTNYLSTRTV